MSDAEVMTTAIIAALFFGGNHEKARQFLHTVQIPDEYRSKIAAGEDVAITVDDQGRLIITPIEQIRAALLETFGMWADRTGIPSDGVDYMDDLRRSRRPSA